MSKQTGDVDVSKALSGLNTARADIRKAALLGIRDAAEYVLGEAVDIVPHETGALSNSGRVSTDDDKFTAVVSFDTPYAVEQHENMAFHHDAGRRAKYLEGPLNSSKEEVLALIARRLKAVR